MHNCYSNRAYMHGYYSTCIYYFISFFSLLSLVLSFFFFFFSLCFFFLLSFPSGLLAVLITSLTNSGLTILVIGAAGFVGSLEATRLGSSVGLWRCRFGGGGWGQWWQGDIWPCGQLALESVLALAVVLVVLLLPLPCLP